MADVSRYRLIRAVDGTVVATGQAALDHPFELGAGPLVHALHWLNLPPRRISDAARFAGRPAGEAGSGGVDITFSVNDNCQPTLHPGERREGPRRELAPGQPGILEGRRMDDGKTGPQGQ